MRSRRPLTWLVTALALAAAPALAQEPNDDPSVSGTTGLFVVPRASTLQPGTFAISGYVLGRALEEGDSVVQQTGATGGFAFGAAERLEIFGTFEPHVGIERDFNVERNEQIPISQAPRLNEHPFADDYWQEGIGDLRVGVKYKVAGDPMEYSGVAVAGVVKLPTSDDEGGIGTGKLDFTPMIIGSYEANETVGLNGFAGFTLRGDPDEFDLRNSFDWGVGVQLPTRSWIQAVVELFGSSLVSDDDVIATPAGTNTGNIGEDSAILQGGFRITTPIGLAISAGYNVNLAFDESNLPQSPYSGFGMLSYSTSRPEPVVYEGTSPRNLPPVNRPPTLSCSAERTTLRLGESVRLTATTTDPDNDPVTVTWTPSAGTITPRQGETVTWSSEGVQPGTGPITARAEDGYGGTADCELRLTVEAPPPPPEPTVLTFMCSEFASGSSRVDNRCKAVLDDVALQLRQNPTATAVITGYSDSQGSADVIQRLSQERADNARQYLVETHSIDASRISTSGAGASNPIADNSTAEGRAQNRRIEIVVTIPPQ